MSLGDEDMKWEDVRAMHPDQFVKFIIVQSTMKNNVETVEEVALLGSVSDREGKYQMFQTPKPWMVMHTTWTKLEIHHHRTYKRSPSQVPKSIAEDALFYLPHDSSWDDILYKLYVLAQIELGIDQIDQGNSIAHEELFQRLRKQIGKNLHDSDGETVFQLPQCPADPRPQDQPVYIEPYCKTCYSPLALVAAVEDKSRAENEVWHDEFICPNCRDGVYMDAPSR